MNECAGYGDAVVVAVAVVVGPAMGCRFSVRMDRIVEMSEATRCSSWSSCLKL